MAQQDLDQNEALEPLQRALADEYSQIRQRAFLLLSFIYDSKAILRAEEQLMSGDSSEQALALEMLDVTLSGGEKAILFPLAAPKLTREKRIQQLNTLIPTTSMPQETRLKEIITIVGDGWNHDWIRACAIYAAGKLGFEELVDEIEAAITCRTPFLRETAAWALHELAPARFKAHAAELAADSDPL